MRRRAERIGASVEAVRRRAVRIASRDRRNIGHFVELGTSRLHLQVLDLADLDHVELIAAEVALQLPG